MITGHSPKLEWRPNPDGSVRSIEEALEIAKKWGVGIPDDVEFFVDEEDSLNQHITARGPRISKHPGEIVSWEDHLNRYGKVPFLIRPDILASDEAIVAVIAHEIYEIEALRPLLVGHRLSIERYHGHTSPTNPGNSHYHAWEVADELVLRMRQEAESCEN